MDTFLEKEEKPGRRVKNAAPGRTVSAGPEA